MYTAIVSTLLAVPLAFAVQPVVEFGEAFVSRRPMA
jgi:hypothetical protein